MRAVSSSRDASPGRPRRTYCGSILASLTYLPQFSVSTLISAAIDSESPGNGSVATFSRNLRVSSLAEISRAGYSCAAASSGGSAAGTRPSNRSEEHTSEIQSQSKLVCRLLLEKKKNKWKTYSLHNT